MERPALIVGSPPRTVLSALQKMSARCSQESEEKCHEAVEHAKRCAVIYWHRMRRGRRFLHERPTHAQSWQLPSLRGLAQDTRVTEVCADICAFGLKAVGLHGGGVRG